MSLNGRLAELSVDEEGKMPGIIESAVSHGGRIKSVRRKERPLKEAFSALTAESNTEGESGPSEADRLETIRR